MKKILFVDDERNVLDGLRRLFHNMSGEWEMHFAMSAGEALEMFKTNSFDAIVSDMRMPEMDGAQLLSEIMRRSPFTARFVLSGQSEKEAILRSVGPAHQFFSKPCNVQFIKDTIRNSLDLRDILHNQEITGIISQIKSLPSIPQVYVSIVEELQKPDPSMHKVSELIQADLGLGTKILQMVNSSFFGLPNHISSIQQAVSFLGMDIIKAMVFSVKVFSQFQSSIISPALLDALMKHSLIVGRYTKNIIEAEQGNKYDIENAFISGCFHDVGKLVFCAYMPKKYRQVPAYIAEHHCGEDEAERAVIGATHGEVGAYMLGLWGLKDVVVEAILFHHSPSMCRNPAPQLLPAVHFSNCLYYQAHENDNKDREMPIAVIDREYFEKHGISAKLDAWRELCQKTERKSHE